MKTRLSYNQTPESGFVLLLTLVIVSIILAIGLSMLHITLKQLTLSNLARESEIALHAASTGIECMQFHRSQPVTRQLLLNEDSDTGDTSAPVLVCADEVALTSGTSHDIDIGSGELLYGYQYRYTVDTDKCVDTSIYLMDLDDATSNVNWTLSENLDTISCDAGNLCTTIFSRGYNHSCDNLDNIFTVERELTIQF